MTDLLNIEWENGRWLNDPSSVLAEGGDLLVTAVDGSDFWRKTGYGFVHDNGHALLHDLSVGWAIEVSFVADFNGLYDQAGLMVRLNSETWIKAGLEHSDGALQLGAVATRGYSDWSLHPVPDWANTEVTVRASRGPDAISVRARSGAGPWNLFRLTPFPETGPVDAGPMICAPTRSGLQVRFTGWRLGPADSELHGD